MKKGEAIIKIKGIGSNLNLEWKERKKGITLIALVITIVLNCSFLAMA